MKKIRTRSAGLLAAVFLLAGGMAPAFASGPDIRGADDRLTLTPRMTKTLDVPYVPTPDKVVNEMLDIAGVGKDDVLYDLGCGDGRIVIHAAQERGARRCVGIDMDPERIRESNENAARANVTGKVRFLQQDLFATDFREATVMTLYLLPSVNLKLRPKILSELRPGTRVVSHDFDMGEWEPDKVSRVGAADTIYFWVVPANVKGTWAWTVKTESGRKEYRLKLDQSFQKVRGTLLTGTSALPLEGARLAGDRLEFTVRREVNGAPVETRFEGRVSGNSLEGSIMPGGESGAERSSWRAERDPATVSPLDAVKAGY